MNDAQPQKRIWWPADWADEVMPPGRSTPDEFIINANGHFWLGYAFDATDATDQDKRYFSKALESDAVVNFLCSDDLGTVEVSVNQDGTFEVHGEVDPKATHFWSPGDSDSLAFSMRDFASQLAEADRDILDIDQWPQRIKVRMASWSDAIPHKLTLSYAAPSFETKARFEQCAGSQ